MKDNEYIRRTGEILLPIIAYGDAAGLPFEKSDPLEHGSLDGLEATTSNPFIGQYPAGTWSDDTHLSVAVAKGLIDAGEFNLEAQAEAHITALRHVTGELTDEDWTPPIVTNGGHSGWGGSTTNSVERLMAGVNPRHSGELNGRGNGVLMKMAPLVFWQYARNSSPDESQQQVVDLTKMTHVAPETIVSSLTHRFVLTALMNQYNPYTDNFEALYRDAIYTAEMYERDFDDQHITSNILERLRDPLTDGHPTGLRRSHILEATPKHGFYAPETLLMAYGSFILESTYPKCVYRAVELGGDADSVGSIVATMSLAMSGNVEQAADHNQIFALKRLERISKQLAHAALKGATNEMA